MRMRAAPRRVLMTTDAVGGVWRYALDLASGLQARGVTTVLAGLGPAPSPAQEKEAERAGLTLRWLSVDLDWTARDQGALGDLPEVLTEARRDTGADLLHLNAPAQAAGLAPECPVVVAAHSCLATWWRAVKSGPMPADWTWRTDLNARGYAAADLVLAPTRGFADEVEAVYGDIPSLTVVHNGTAARAPSGPKRETIVAVGRWWDEAKNLSVLDEAAENVEWPIEAIGSLAGPNGAEVAAVRSVKAPGEVAADEVARRLDGASIFVSPALYEPFGLGVLEAAQAGNALVLSDIATFRELWADAALFVSPRDPRAIAAALNRVARDPSLRASLAEAARRRAARYTLHAQADGVLAAYARALASRSLASAH